MVFASDTILAFAGGVGITRILGHLQNCTISTLSNSHTLDHSSFQSRRFVLNWLVRYRSKVEAIMPLLPDPKTMQHLGVELLISCSGEPADRLEPIMLDEIRWQVAEAVWLKGARISFHEEAFTW